MTFRELCERARLNQAELSRRSGVHPATISQLYSGKIRSPRYVTVLALADALGLTAAVVAKAIEKSWRENLGRRAA